MTDENLSLEKLENRVLVEPSISSYTASGCYKAWQKPLNVLTAEEIRLLIGQKMGLVHLIPIALDILKKDPLTEVTFYEGDLLTELLRLDISDWNEKEQLTRFKKLLSENSDKLKNSEDIKQELLDKYL